MVKLSLILILFALPILVRAKTQKVIAYGTFICQSSEKEAKGIKLKLLSKDDVGITTTNVMATNKTDSTGSFYIDGSEKGVVLGTIDPHLQIYHDCNDGWKPCSRHWNLQIPSDYVFNEGAKAKPFNFGTINLDIVLPGEDRSCLGALGKREVDWNDFTDQIS